MGRYCPICEVRYEMGVCEHNEEAHRQHEADDLDGRLSRIESKLAQLAQLPLDPTAIVFRATGNRDEFDRLPVGAYFRWVDDPSSSVVVRIKIGPRTYLKLKSDGVESRSFTFDEEMQQLAEVLGIVE